MAGSCYRPSKNYIPASYKGVAFDVEESGSEHGRRGQQAEFPFSERTAYVDMGIKIRTYSISGIFSGNDHIQRMAALIAAVESRGAGTLVHPTLGVLTVACSSLSVKDDQKESAGVTRFTIEFVDARTLSNGFSFGDSVYGIAIETVISAVSSSFIQNYRPDLDQWYYRDAVSSAMSRQVNALDTAYQVSVASNKGDEEIRTITDFATIRLDPYIMADPEKASRVIQNSYSLIDSSPESPARRIQIIRSVMNESTDAITVTGNAANSISAIYAMMRGVGVAYLTRMYLEYEPETFSDAMRDFNRIKRILEQEISYAKENCKDDDLYLALMDFRSKALRELMTRAFNSPALVTYKFPHPVPSLVAAYEIFGDAKRYREIERRNTGMPWAVGKDVIAQKVS